MKFFNKIVKRVVSFPIESYDENGDTISNFFSRNNLFQLSILFASRSLYNDVKKNKLEKTNLSLEKYFSRAHFNPIPFGFFTSIGTTEWSDTTSLSKSKTLEVKTEFDNFYITEKTALLEYQQWKEHNYFINPSIHFLNPEKISFYKSQKLPIGSYETKYVEIDYDEDIQWLMDRFENGASIDAVTNDLLKNDFSIQEIDDFLMEIIHAGLIISETTFYPYSKTIYNHPDFSKLVNKNIHELKNESDIAQFSEAYVEEQDSFLSDKEIQSTYSHSITLFEKENDFLSTKIQEQLIKYVKFNYNYNNSHTPITNALLEFGNKFYHSYNDGFIPLSKVFNPYSGLKYTSIKLKTESRIHSDIMTKILTAASRDLHLQNTKEIEFKRNQLPATFNVVFEVLNCKKTGKEIIYCKSVTGTSAINLLSRFNHVSESLCQDIAHFEKEVYAGKIIAEVNMIARPRALNIVSSHQYYDYNIPINTVHSNNSNPILLSDIYMKFNGSRFILVSKKHQKEVIPRVTSSINNALSDSEAYRFLADLQSQNNEIHHINFNLNYYKNVLIQYVPRIYLEDDILLYPAQILLINDNYTIDGFKKKVLETIQKNNFSKKVSLTDTKGDIIIDVENDEQLKILFSKLKTTNTIYVSECLYESFLPAISREKKHYAHEFAASIKNTEFINTQSAFVLPENNVSIPQNIPIVSNWLYFNLQCNIYGQNELLTIINDTILSQKSIEKFFYVRYDYPENHLRVRFQTESQEVKDYIIKKIHELKLRNIILNYTILPYEQEMYRYGGNELMQLTEQIFYLDSLDTITNSIKKDQDSNETICSSIFKIKEFLQFFDFQIDEMIRFCEINIDQFSNEFVLAADLKKELNKKFAEIKNSLGEASVTNFLDFSDLKTQVGNVLNKSNLVKSNYLVDLIHMSMNRLYDNDQRYQEFKSYYFAKLYFNKLKFTQKNNHDKSVHIFN
ncbi:lantibiotic dehydratase [Flavobacterium hungaricum]|uniref:Lantibiotic dehydratase n=1 Tax=Flavobacterium hungaricum TaxID=2082725 RepID=A0ABR9TS36_9FLAO|nr:lantibiotic dehydratase [Flavobacterium hungaricum]MBE8727864.1 hypothetical protein [Flavobacterium hungaricum]